MKTLGTLIILTVIAVTFGAFVPSKQTAALLPLTQSEKTQTDPALILPDGLTASAALLANLSTGQIEGGYNVDAPLPIASITKLMTAHIALKHATLDDIITVSANAVRTESAAGLLKVGEQFYLRDLLAIMLLESSNDAATAIAEHVGGEEGATAFIRMMNDERERIGMTQTFFQNPTGLDVENRPTNYASANDILLLIRTLNGDSVMWDFTREGEHVTTSLDGFVRVMHNTNALASRIPFLVGSKTGTTDASGESIVLLFERPLGIAHALILLGSPHGERENDILRVLTANHINLIYE